MTVRVGYRFLLPFFLLGLCILVIPVVHAEQNPDPDSALGMVVENINNAVDTVLEPKHPATSDYYALMEYGDHCAKRGDYKNALGYYNAALDRVESTSKNTLTSTANAHRASIYERKAGIYHQRGEPGDEAREKGATQTAEEYQSKTSSGSFGCLIATATYGSPQASEVQLVREYRDGMIRTSYSGSRFVEGFNLWYYSFSPAVAGYIENHPLVKSVMQVCLIPLLYIILVSQKIFVIMGFSPEAALITVLIFGASMYSLIYIFPIALLILVFAGRKGVKIPSISVMRYMFIIWAMVLGTLVIAVFGSLDTLTVVSSGLLVICSILLTSGTASLSLAGCILKKPVTG